MQQPGSMADADKAVSQDEPDSNTLSPALRPPQPPKTSGRGHPFVSEAQEGRPICEGVIFLVVLIAALVAFCGYTWAEKGLVSDSALFCLELSLINNYSIHCKVRSVPFDTFISISLGIGLLVTYTSIQLML